MLCRDMHVAGDDVSGAVQARAGRAAAAAAPPAAAAPAQRGPGHPLPAVVLLLHRGLLDVPQVGRNKPCCSCSSVLQCSREAALRVHWSIWPSRCSNPAGCCSTLHLFLSWCTHTACPEMGYTWDRTGFVAWTSASPSRGLLVLLQIHSKEPAGGDHLECAAGAAFRLAAAAAHLRVILAVHSRCHSSAADVISRTDVLDTATLHLQACAVVT